MAKAFVVLAAAAALAVSGPAWAQPELAAPSGQPDAPTSATPPAENTSPPAVTSPNLPADAPVVASTVRTAPPVFIALTPGKAAFAVVGAFAMIAEGKKIVEANGLEDSGPAMAAGLAGLFAASKQARLSETPVTITDEHTDKILAAGNGARYIVDVGVNAWEAMYFSTDWSHYALMYGARLRIFDTATGKIILNGRCFIKPVKTPDAPSYDELMADRAARLKAMTATASQACLADLKANVLKL